MLRVARVLLAAASVLALTAAPASATPLPPPAPRPTSSGNSPAAPDPHPPLGGIGPDGTVVGGTRLLERGTIVPANAPKLPTGLTARAWVLTDLDTGAILAARDPHGRYQPASILKALTCQVLLPLLPGSRVVTASADAANAEGSAVGLVAGGRYSIDTLFRSLLLMSGNDAATALAQAAGGVPQTVARMNAEAHALGMYDTYVQTPSGLDGWQQLTSAYDLSLVLQALSHNARFLAYDRTATAQLPAQKVGARKWGSVPLANQEQQFFDTVPGALIAKNGYTDAAQHTYLAATDRGGRRLGVVFLRAQRQPTDQWQQAASLLDWGYALPATSPVGRLVTPAAAPSAGTTAPPRSSSASRRPPTAPSTAAMTRSAGRPTGTTLAAPTGRRTSALTPSLLAAAVTLLVLAALTVLLRRSRRRH